MSRGPKVSPYKRRQVIQMHKDGETQPTIAYLLGISQWSVSRIIKEDKDGQ